VGANELPIGEQISRPQVGEAPCCSAALADRLVEGGGAGGVPLVARLVRRRAGRHDRHRRSRRRVHVGDWPGAVTAPTLLLAADPALDARLQPAAAAAVLKTLHDGRLVTFTGTGHVIHGRRAAEFCRAVTAFLGA